MHVLIEQDFWNCGVPLRFEKTFVVMSSVLNTLYQGYLKIVQIFLTMKYDLAIHSKLDNEVIERIVSFRLNHHWNFIHEVACEERLGDVRFTRQVVKIFEYRQSIRYEWPDEVIHCSC